MFTLTTACCLYTVVLLNTKCVSELGQVYKLINSETIAFNTYIIPIQSHTKKYPMSIVIKLQPTAPDVPDAILFSIDRFNMNVWKNCW
jgi:hypothetical protein